MTESEAIEVLRSAGVLHGLLATAELLACGSGDDAANGPRWERLDDTELSTHVLRHVARVCADVRRIDLDSGHPEACHVAARGLMLATRAAR